ncbi:filamentous hemagglutinin N-terminal domain-containing protein, partial [Campylobacter sp. IFREMER_LSEM_CL1846]|uniref:two-partner secretion domain-containing protein n=1 Tax=Campylobacter sp. IFREMER_LSEM_CL1846 TaxID=2911614 RepID=UPI0021E64CA1
MKKLSNHIILSGITVSMLFSPLMALPSGGKFTHGTSGTINRPNDNTLNINGHGTNSVIQWGGGFSIGKGESVNFNGSNKNYLNIAHGTSKSTIEGVLNAKGNNVFLINPNGVIITKTGTINANRFVASTSSMGDEDIQKFAKMQKFDDGLTFSPVFKPQKAGNVVNMGNINANNVLLIGNKVLLYGTFDIKSKTFNQIAALDKDKKTNIYLVGNETHADIATLNNTDKLHITAKDEGSLYLGATGYYYNPSSFKSFNYKQQDYDNALDETGNKIEVKHNNEKFLNNKFIGISSDVDWWHFAKGWNENKSDFSKNIEYRLTNNINFKGNQGKGKEGKDWQNYANYCIDGLDCTSMMIGDNKNPFTKTFDGQG